VSQDNAPKLPDLLTGAEQIAAELGWRPSQVYKAVRARAGWPIWREGKLLHSSRAALATHIAKRAEESVQRQAAEREKKS